MADPLRFPAPPAGGPVRRSALGGLAGELASLPTGLRIAEVPFPGVLSLRGDAGQGEFATVVERAIGVAPVAEPGRVLTAEGCHLLCLEHDAWLAVLPSGREETALRLLDQALEGLPTAAVDLSDAHVVLDLSGPLARPVLSKGCPLDLHARALPPGRCARSALAGLGVIVQALEGGALRLFLGVATARWAVSWLQDQVSEY
ncbi:sarcosine oxidase subunit gamma [Novispirillum sp. DQ9]|uniref:sarcosine oxidase subunit gamma n=1 Tax=Novispirillum sp. DQ9 TaxID=3398612 RepID=UPI003C7B3DE6